MKLRMSHLNSNLHNDEDVKLNYFHLTKDERISRSEKFQTLAKIAFVKQL